VHQLVTSATAHTVLVNVSAFAQKVPALKQGEQYFDVSNKLMEAGWQMEGGDSINDCRFYPNM